MHATTVSGALFGKSLETLVRPSLNLTAASAVDVDASIISAPLRKLGNFLLQPGSNPTLFLARSSRQSFLAILSAIEVEAAPIDPSFDVAVAEILVLVIDSLAEPLFPKNLRSIFERPVSSLSQAEEVAQLLPPENYCLFRWLMKCTGAFVKGARLLSPSIERLACLFAVVLFQAGDASDDYGTMQRTQFLLFYLSDDPYQLRSA